jgi:vitamin B12 transporter
MAAEQVDADGEEDTEEAVETIVVTAHRTPIPINQAGSAVSLLNQDNIVARQQVFTADLLRDLPGVSLNRTATNGSLTQVRVRGAEANHLLVVIDGVEVNDPAAGDEFNFGSLTNYDIASIELVRGPQSALWGSDAMAGILNITTRRSTEPLSASAFLEGGSFGTLSGGGRIGVANKRGGLTFNASRYETDGESAAIAGREKDGYENTTLGLNGRYQITDTFQVGFSGRYTDETIMFDGVSDGIPVDTDDETDREQAQFSVDAGLTVLEGRWVNTLRYTYLDTDNQTSGGLPSTYAARKDGLYFQSTFNLGSGPRIDRHRLTLAVDYEDEEYEQRTSFADQDQTLDNLGVVLEYFAQPIDPLTLSASVRYDDNSDFEDVTTYRGTGSYRIERLGTRLKGSFGTGQKRPTFTERFGFDPDLFIGNPDLAPEKNKGFDLGIEQPFFADRARVSATYFNEKLEDEILLIGFPSTPINLDGKSKRQGVELELYAGLTHDLTLTANYTYTDSKQPPSDPEDGDLREIRRPRHQAAINLNHGFDDKRGNVNLNVSYTSSQTDTFFAFPAQTVTLDAYTLVNVTGEYALTPWLTLFARAENLFSEDQQDVFGYQSPGRAFYGGFRIGSR